jgi:hypothetical protein
MSNDNVVTTVDSLAALVTKLNDDVRDLPPGRERSARLREIAQGYRDRATSDHERRFWDAFLRAFPE